MTNVIVACGLLSGLYLDFICVPGRVAGLHLTSYRCAGRGISCRAQHWYFRSWPGLQACLRGQLHSARLATGLCDGAWPCAAELACEGMSVCRQRDSMLSPALLSLPRTSSTGPLLW